MLITRYLFKNLLVVTGFIAFTLTAVIWLTQSLKLLELVATSDAPSGLFVQMVVLALPRFLEIIIPLSLVAGTLFIYNKMIADNELIVLRACGFDQMTLARPALIIALGLTAVLLCLTTWLSPKGQLEMKSLRAAVKTQYSAFLLREGVFNTFGSDLTVYLRARAPNGDLLGLLIHDARDKDKPPVTVTARRGQIIMLDDIPHIFVYDGLRQQIDDNGAVSKLFFSRHKIEIKGLDRDAGTRWADAEERTLPQLLRPAPDDERAQALRGEFMAEATQRLLTPLNAVGFTLVALACILLGPFNRRGQTRKILLAVGIIVALQAANIGLASAAQKNTALLPLLYLLTIGPVVLGFALLTDNGAAAARRLLSRFGKKPRERRA